MAMIEQDHGWWNCPKCAAMHLHAAERMFELMAGRR